MKLSPFYQFLLLVFVTLVVYYPTLFAPYNSLDDKVFVTQLMNQEGFSLARHFSPGGAYDFYRPLISLSFELDKYVGGLEEPFMHLVNVLVHLVNVILIWLVACRFGTFAKKPSVWLPLLAALLFALHPINTEAVNWIAGRTDLLAGTFVFFSLFALLEFMNRRSWFWGGVSAIAILGGALCKETALFFIPVACFLLLYVTGRSNSTWKQRWGLPALYGMAVTAYFTLRWEAFQTDRGLGNTALLVSKVVGMTIPAGDGVPVEAPFPFLAAVSAITKASGFYVVKLFQPLPLNFAIHRVDNLYLIPGVALFLGLLLIAFRRDLVGWLFLTSASIAVSALMVLFTSLAWTPIAERYMYIPCGPFVIGLVYAVGPRLKSLTLQKLATVIVFLLLGGACWMTAARNIVWQDNLTLYQDAVRQSPDFAPAKTQLAIALIAHNREDEAYAIIANNKELDNLTSLMNNAVVLMEQVNYAAARAALVQLLENEHGYREVKILEKLVSITRMYLDELTDDDLKRIGYKDMLDWLERIKDITPNGFNYYRIGQIHLLLDDKVAARQAFVEAAKRFPEGSIYKKPATQLARDLVQ